MDILEPIKSLFRRIDKQPTGDFVKQRRYQVSVTNLSSRRHVMQLRGKRGSLWALFIILVSLIVAVWTLAIIFTPLRRVMPARLSGDLRDQYVELSLRADSAMSEAKKVDRYSSNILAILQDSVPEQQFNPDGAVTLPIDSLMEASEAERRFVQRYEAQERYNVSVLSPIAAEGMTFYPPMTGATSENRISDGGIPYVTFKAGRQTPVSAIYRGTVISSYFTTGRGVTLVIQHPNGFISQYSGIVDPFVTRGDKVNAGQCIGIASDAMPFTFELWHNGSPLSPASYIAL